MNALLAILVIVLGLIVWPILAGVLFFLCTGFPVYLLSVLFNICGKIVTLAFSKMLIVPFLGRMLRIAISTVIGTCLIGMVTVGIAVPFIFIACMFVNGEASQPDVECDGWLVDFYCTHFKWLAHMCNCKYLLAYSATEEPYDNILILMNKAVLESIPMTVGVMMPWYFNLRILLWTFQNWLNDRE